MHAGLFAGLENGTLRPVVGKELPLAEAARAHKEILEPGSAGKIVLICYDHRHIGEEGRPL
jgi:NADPH2:quinone reductase